MMKKTILSLFLLTTLLGCQYLPGQEATDEQTDQNETIMADYEDDIVEVPADLEILALSDDEKSEQYAQWDQIRESTQESKTPTSYSQVIPLRSEVEYYDFILETSDTPALIYLAYDECTYCRAFTPKINQLAKELDLPIYYYNVRQRDRDPNFQSAMENYRIQVVPHAFIVTDGKPSDPLNANSSMEEIESTLRHLADLVQKAD